MTGSSRASASMSIRSITAASPRRRSTSPIPSGSRCCAARRARSMARTPRRARSTSSPARPASHPEARVELSAGNYDFFQGKASVSGPLVDDKVAVRLSTSITTRRGTIYNTRQQEWQNSQDNLSLRSQFLWHATPTLDLTLSGDYARQNPNCCVQYYARVGRPSARSTGNMPRWRRRRAIACPRPTPSTG